jgi:hypothetical protein
VQFASSPRACRPDALFAELLLSATAAGAVSFGVMRVNGHDDDRAARDCEN